MGRKKYYKKRNYTPKSFKMSRRGGDNPIAVAVVVGLILWALFWFLFWVGVIGLVIGIFYGVHWLNEEFGGYETDYYIAPILSYLAVAIIVLFGGAAILQNMGKIDNTFLNWGKEGSNYVTIGKTKQGHHEPQVNKEGIVEKTVISQLPEGNVKQIAEIPGIIINNSVDTVHDWFMQGLKKIFTRN